MFGRCTFKQFALEGSTFMDPLPWSSSYRQSNPENILGTFTFNVTRITISLTKSTQQSIFLWSCLKPKQPRDTLVAWITTLINLHKFAWTQLFPPLICSSSRLFPAYFAPVGTTKASLSKYSLPGIIPLGPRPHAKYKTTSAPSTKAALSQLWYIARHWIQLPKWSTMSKSH